MPVGDTRYTSKSTPETRAHAKLFGETEIEIDLESFLKDRTVNKLIIYCDPEYMPQVLERSKKFKTKKIVSVLIQPITCLSIAIRLSTKAMEFKSCASTLV